MTRLIKAIVLCVLTATIVNNLAGSSPPLAKPENGLGGQKQEKKWLKYDDYNDNDTRPSEQVNKNETEEICAICNKNYEQFPAFQFDCGHKFHEHCLRNWDWEFEFKQTTRTTCANCCKEIKTIDGRSLQQFLAKRQMDLHEHMKKMWGVITSTRSIFDS